MEFTCDTNKKDSAVVLPHSGKVYLIPSSNNAVHLTPDSARKLAATLNQLADFLEVN